MEIHVTEEERELLEYARWSCGCEAYYRFRCSKCRQSGEGFVTDRPTGYKSLKEAGMIYHNSYHGLRPTKAGAVLCENLGITVWPVRIGGADKYE